jgi:hypothetical protein
MTPPRSSGFRRRAMDLPKGLSPFLSTQLNFLSDTNNFILNMLQKYSNFATHQTDDFTVLWQNVYENLVNRIPADFDKSK